jgi:hypothetical protein
MNAQYSSDGLDRPSFLKCYWLGLVLSAMLAGFVVFLSVCVLTATGYGLIGIATIALTGGPPLLIALLVAWVYYMIRARGRTPALLHAAMFIPTALALCIVPVAKEIRHDDQDRFSSAHPDIEEVHVNLSGRDVWLSTGSYARTMSNSRPSETMRAATAQFVSFRRSAVQKEIDEGSFPYDGARLRQGIGTYPPDLGEESGGSPPHGPLLPLVRMPYPDLSSLLPFAPENELLVYQYFHYPDRVEVAPTLARFAGATSDSLQDKVHGLVLFNIAISNQQPLTLVRMEVDGQTLALSDDEAVDSDMQCRYGNLAVGEAWVNIDRPLHLRWQTLADPQRWHEATVSVPAFRRVSSASGRTGWPQVLLYFLGNDQVAAERFVEIRLPGDKLAVRATGMPSEVQANTMCGSAKDRYDLNNVTLLP